MAASSSMQSDPIGYGDGMNWYNYAHGDPVNRFDPLGLETHCPSIVVGFHYGYETGQNNHYVSVDLGCYADDAVDHINQQMNDAQRAFSQHVSQVIGAVTKMKRLPNELPCSEMVSDFAKAGDMMQKSGVVIGVGGGVGTFFAPEAIAPEVAVGAGVRMYALGAAMKDSVSIHNLIFHGGDGSGFALGKANDILLNDIPEGPMHDYLSSQLDKVEESVGLTSGDGGTCKAE